MQKRGVRWGGWQGREGQGREKLKALVFNSEVRKDSLSSPGRPSAQQCHEQRQPCGYSLRLFQSAGASRLPNRRTTKNGGQGDK